MFNLCTVHRPLALVLLLCGVTVAAPKGLGAQGHSHAHADSAHAHQEHSDDATISHRFEEADVWADRFEDPSRDAWQRPDLVIKQLIHRDDLLVADIGSATGYFPVRFAQAVPRGRVFGADIESGMVVYLNDRARKENLTNLVSILAETDNPHLPQRVDLVFICNTYHHIDSRIAYFRNLHDQLNPKAKIAVVDYRPDSKRGPPHKLAPNVVTRELREAGYILESSFDFLPEQYFLVYRAP